MRGLLFAAFGLAALLGVGAIASLVILTFGGVTKAVDKSVEDDVKRFRHRGFL